MNKKIVKILLDLVMSFFFGAAIIFIVLVSYGFRYMIKYGTGKFAFVVNGLGVQADQWQILTVNQILVMCACGGLVLLFLDLVWILMKLIHGE